jgi:hypothetical protein
MGMAERQKKIFAWLKTSCIFLHFFREPLHLKFKANGILPPLIKYSRDKVDAEFFCCTKNEEKNQV